MDSKRLCRRRRLRLAGVTAIVSTVVGCGGGQGPEETTNAPTGQVSAEQVREIARQAYIYGYPVVDKLPNSVRLLPGPAEQAVR